MKTQLSNLQVISFNAIQLVAMCLRNVEFGSLLALGVVLFAILALPGMLVAMLV